MWEIIAHLVGKDVTIIHLYRWPVESLLSDFSLCFADIHIIASHQGLSLMFLYLVGVRLAVYY